MIQFLRRLQLDITLDDGEVHTIKCGFQDPQTKQIEAGLRVYFEVDFSIIGAPALSRITVYNLSRDRVKRLQSQGGDVKLKVGYADAPLRQLVTSKVRNITHTRNGTDTETVIYAGGSERAFRDGYHSGTYGKGTRLSSIIASVCSDFKANDGDEVILGSIVGLDGEVSTDVYTLAAPCRDILAELGTMHNFWWIVAGGVLSICHKDSAFEQEGVIILNKNSGLLGVPEVTTIGADVRCLLNPDIQPLKIIQIQSADPTINVPNLQYRDATQRTLGEGLYRVQKVVHKGDSRDGDWVSEIIGKDYIPTSNLLGPT